jgi:L-ornithine N5-oxygenase
MTSPTSIVDVLGIGFGPANIALAIALEELAPHLRVAFVEKRLDSFWQPNMLLPGSDIQNHPLRDLVTPRNPRSRYTFTNFLYEHDRLYEHLNLPLHYPLRAEYAHYVSWVAGFFGDRVLYGCQADAVEAVCASEGSSPHFKVHCTEGRVLHARSLVIAPGRTPHIPAPFAGLDDVRVRHLNDYLPALADALAATAGKCRIAVIGGSQSSVEILLHASEQFGVREVVGYTRNFGYRQKDTSPFSEEVYFPSFVDTFYHASAKHKERLRKELVNTNYSSADIDVLNQLYVRRYEQSLFGDRRLQLRTCEEIQACRPSAIGLEIESLHYLEGGTHQQTFDLVILATGFLDLGGGDRQEPFPPLLRRFAADNQLDGFSIGRDYRIDLIEGPPAYLNGLCESSHGMGDAGSFSLLALRSKTIVQSLVRQLGLAEQPARQ